MASLVSTEVVISLGTLPSPAGTQVSIDFVSGVNHVSALKNKVQSRIGEDPLNFKGYLTIPTASAEAANLLKDHLNKALTEALSDSSSMLGQLYSKLKPDPDEPALASFEFKSHQHNVYAIVTAGQHEEQANMMYEMAVSQASEIFNTGNSLHVEIDTGKTAGEIISPNMAQMLTDSALFKIVFTHDSNAIVHARELVNGLGLDRKISRALGYLTLYSGASLKLNFKSGVDLPEGVQAMLNSVSSMIPPLNEVLPPDVLKLVNGIIEHAGHEVLLNVLTDNVALEVHLSMKGASQIFQFN